MRYRIQDIRPYLLIERFFLRYLIQYGSGEAPLETMQQVRKMMPTRSGAISFSCESQGSESEGLTATWRDHLEDTISWF